jgi:hypothetical protein
MAKHQHSARRRLINKTKKFLSTYSGGDAKGCNTSINQDDRNECNERVKGVIEGKQCNYDNNYNIYCNGTRIDIIELVKFKYDKDVYYKAIIENINVLIFKSNNEFDYFILDEMQKNSPHFLYLYSKLEIESYAQNQLVVDEFVYYILENVDGIIEVSNNIINMTIYMQIILAIYQFHSYTKKILNFTKENINKLFFIKNNESNILIYELKDTKYILKNVEYIVILNDFTNLENINDSNRNNDYNFLKDIIPNLDIATSIEKKLEFLVNNNYLSNEVDNYQDYKPYKLNPRKKVRFAEDIHSRETFQQRHETSAAISPGFAIRMQDNNDILKPRSTLARTPEQSQTSQTDFKKYTIADKELKAAIMSAVGTNLEHSYVKYQEYLNQLQRSQGSQGGKKSKSKIKMKLKNISKKLKGGFDDRFKNLEYRLWAANKLRECYPEKFKFSDWVIEKKKFDNYLFGETMVLYDNNDALDEVIKTVYYRDPVNITFHRYYDAKILYENFNYNQANYLNNLYFTDNNNTYKKNYGGDIYDCMSSLDKSTKDYELKPNIAVFCNATINCNTGHFNQLYINVNLNNIKVNVLNLIGYGFDNKKQPDYLYIENITNTTERLNEVIKLYRKMWLKLAHFCKIYNNSKNQEDKITNVILSNVGGGVFSSSINDLLKLQNYNFYHNIFIPSFGNKDNNNIVDNLASPFFILNTTLGINVFISFDRNNNVDNIYRVPNIIYNIENMETYSNKKTILLQDLKNPTLKNTLFVNAWDPHSIIGNGNSNDPSLDGYWGHISNMSVLGWGFTNPEMTYVPVDFTKM